MRAVIQRCLSASVTVEGEIISSISRGLLVLIGINKTDTPRDSEVLIKKILGLRLFDAPAVDVDAGVGENAGEAVDAEGSKSRSQSWKKNVMDIGGEILCVSQFTLMARTEKGSKPDFHEAMPGPLSKPMYESILEELGRIYRPDRIKDGKFAAMMQVSLCNDGPITIILDTRSPDVTNGNPNQNQTQNRNQAKPGKTIANDPTSTLTPEERIEQGKEKAKASREKRIRAKLDWEAKKKLEAPENGEVKEGMA